jgi:hypothetical protein
MLTNPIKPVIVTAFFNLKNLPDSNSSIRPIEFYLDKCKPTLSAQSDMVIFCDQSTKPLIEKIRKELCSNFSTYYVEKNIVEYDFFKLAYSIIVENRKKSLDYKDPEERNTASAFLTYIFKIIAIRISSQIAENASHFAWVDFGYSHIAKGSIENGLSEMINNILPKIAVTYIHYRPRAALADPRRYLAYGGLCGIAAGVITVERSYVDILYTRFMSIFYDHLSMGIGHSEEQILTFMYDKYPEMFTLRYGDYYSLLSNYVNITQDYGAIRKFFIDETIKHGMLDLDRSPAKEVISSVEKNLLEINSTEISFLRKLI